MRGIINRLSMRDDSVVSTVANASVHSVQTGPTTFILHVFQFQVRRACSTFSTSGWQPGSSGKREIAAIKLHHGKMTAAAAAEKSKMIICVSPAATQQ